MNFSLLTTTFFLISMPILANGIRLFGDCKDEHDCDTCAGYSWCEATQYCLRTWEQNCL